MTILEPPTLDSPSDGACDTSLALQLNWRSGTLEFDAYSVEIATDPEFQNIVQSCTGITDQYYVASGLSQGTVYYWRVSGNLADAQSPWTAPWSFATGSMLSAAKAATHPPPPWE